MDQLMFADFPGTGIIGSADRQASRGGAQLRLRVLYHSGRDPAAAGVGAEYARRPIRGVRLRRRSIRDGGNPHLNGAAELAPMQPPRSW